MKNRKPIPFQIGIQFLWKKQSHVQILNRIKYTIYVIMPFNTIYLSFIFTNFVNRKNPLLTLYKKHITEMKNTVEFESELNSYVDREKKAVDLNNTLGKLLYGQSVELVLFRNHLVDRSISELLKMHKNAQNADLAFF